MDMYLKRYFWVGQLTLVLASSLLGALAVNNVLKGQLSTFLVPPAKSAKAAPKPKTPKTRTPTLSALGTERWTPDPVKEETKEDPNAAETKTEEEEVPAIADGEYPLSDLNIQLNGTMVAAAPQYSMAMMQDRGSKATLLMNVGEKFQEKYDPKMGEIVKIDRDRIVIKREGRLEQIDMENQKGRAKGKGKNKFSSSSRARSTPSKPTPSPRPTTSPKVSSKPSRGNSKLDKLRGGITKKSDNNYSIKRETIQEVIKNPRLLRDGTKPVPNYVGGKPNGFKLVGMKDGSIFNDLGLRRDDIITGVNGKKLTNPNVALEFYNKFNSGNLSNVKLDIERGGKPTTISFGVD